MKDMLTSRYYPWTIGTNPEVLGSPGRSDGVGRPGGSIAADARRHHPRRLDRGRGAPRPVPGDSDLLVRVHGAGLNGADMLQLKGRYPAPPGAPQDIPGLELAGEVVECGPGVQRFEPGDRVMSIVAGGGQAELAVVHERTAMPVPEELGWEAAGGVPEVFTTAHDALFTQAGLRAGEHLLVHGAAGGVGMAAVQLGQMAGARVTATVRNPELAHASTPSTSTPSSPTASRSTARSTSSSSSSARPTSPATSRRSRPAGASR